MSYYISHKTLVARQEPAIETSAAPALSPPVIAGIAVGSFFLLALILFGIFFAIRYKKRNKVAVKKSKKSKIVHEMNPKAVEEEDEEGRIYWDNNALDEKYEDIILPPSEWHSTPDNKYR